MWEDPNNSSGGHFKLIAVTQETSWHIWEAIVLRVIGALFPDNNVIVCPHYPSVLLLLVVFLEVQHIEAFQLRSRCGRHTPEGWGLR